MVSINKATSASNSNFSPQLHPQFDLHKKILQTINEMLTERGYDINLNQNQNNNNNDDENCQEPDFKCMATMGNSDVIYVYFASDLKVPVKRMREYIQHLKECKVTHAIIVYAQQITPGAKAEIDKHTDLDIETFTARELSQNPTRHHLVPKHEQLGGDAEVLKLLKEFHLQNKSQLPRLAEDDIIARYYHWQPGVVVKITRILGNQQEPQFYYREVRKI